MIPKFRCWDEPNKIMRFNNEIVIWNDQVYINGKKELDSRIKGYSCLSEHLMQSTGLKDKNGVEIYEGDIVENQYSNVGYVAYLQQESGFVVVLKNSDYRLGHRNTGESYDVANNHEVIGNIYSNTEILEAKKCLKY